MIKQIFFLLLLSLFFIQVLLAQKTVSYHNPTSDYELAKELFEKEKYGAAQKIFTELLHSTNATENQILMDAEYYASMCALELSHKDALSLVEAFIQKYPESYHSKRAYIKLGNYLYDHRKYRDALLYYQKVKIAYLNKKEVDEYYFKIGYCNLKKNKTDRASSYFQKVLNSDSEYAPAAKYYFSHISYEEKNYKKALPGFLELTNDNDFAKIVPYYIIQIYYLENRTDELLDFAPKYYNVASKKRKPEIANILGNTYYKASQYENAKKYLNDFINLSNRASSSEDFYKLAFSNFKTNDYENAIIYFEKVCSKKDELAQLAYYYLGHSHIQSKQKQYAANAFLSAYKTGNDSKIKEDALFTYAKLSYELNNDPYGESVKALQSYIDEFPNSEKTDEAFSYLVNIYLSSKNYESAIRSFKSVKQPNLELKRAYQKITHYYGVEEFNKNKLDKAINLFDKSLQYEFDDKLNAANIFWKAEAFYRKRKFNSARKFYNKFLKEPGAYSISEYSTANYNIAYTYFNQKKYASALKSFRLFLKQKSPKPKLVSDANVRIGDCYFVQKKYNNAIKYYDKSMINDKRVYPTFQKALAQGALGDSYQKIASLKLLLNEYPNSPYSDDAYYEIANSYLNKNKSQEALSNFKELEKKHPNSLYVKKAMLKTGLIYYNDDKNSKALAILKKVVSDYPGTVESKQALGSIRDIFVDLNRVNDYFEYSKTVSFANVSNAEKDSLAYIALENQYLSGNVVGAKEKFEKYISDFPNGAFRTNAEFYLAENLHKSGDKNSALESYQYVIKQSPGQFHETSLLRASSIQFQNKNYKKSLEYYKKLQKTANYPENVIIAKTGIMRSQKNLNQFEKAALSALDLLKEDKVSQIAKNEANLIVGKSELAKKEHANAQKYLVQLANNDQGINGAEAAYLLCFIAFENNDETIEDKIYKTINEYGTYDHWVAKNFILLSDVFTNKGNIFQAKQTLQSVIDNHKGEKLVQQAKEKLATLIKIEEAELKRKEKEAKKADEVEEELELD